MSSSKFAAAIGSDSITADSELYTINVGSNHCSSNRIYFSSVSALNLTERSFDNVYQLINLYLFYIAYKEYATSHG